MAETVFNANQITSPEWAGDFLNREHLVPGGAKLNTAQFVAQDAVVVTVDVAGAAANATSVPVTALSGPVPSGTTLHFGPKKFATLTAAAATGATSLTVEALPTALVGGDQATYAGTKKKVVKSGTFVGRTITERDAGTGFGPAASSDDEVYLVAFDIADADRDSDVDLYRHGSIVKENFLPDITAIQADAGLLAKLRANYTCTKGAA